MPVKKFPYWLSLMLVIMAGIASWAIYQTLNLAIRDIFVNVFNIDNLYIQNLTIVALVFLIFTIIGVKGKKAIGRILGR